MNVRIAVLVVVVALALASCSDNGVTPPAKGNSSGDLSQTSGQTGGLGSGQSAGSLAGQSSGVQSGSGPTSGEIASGSASGQGASGAALSNSGAAATMGASGSSTDAGPTGASGSATDGGAVFKKFQCPAGPYPPQGQGAATPVCNNPGFKYNYGYNEGPTWVASQNAFFFSNFVQGNTSANKTAGDIIKVSLAPDGSATCEVWLHDVGCNGLHVSFATGKLLGACHGPRAVMEYDPATKAPRVVANMVGGQMFDAPNDIISTSNGNIYFSNPLFELGGRPQGVGNALIRIDPTGATSIVQKGGCNGVTLSPDEKMLYVVGLGVWMLNADGSPGMKTNQGAPGGDGLSMDCAGHVLSIATMGAFGGPDGKTLLAVGGGTNAKLIQMAVPGFP